MTLQDLLNKTPHKIQVEFVLECCNDIKHLLTDKRSLRALEITQLWLEDKATYKEVKDAAYYANSVSYIAAAANTAANATHSVYANNYYAVAYASTAATNAAYSANPIYADTNAYTYAHAAHTATRCVAKALGVPEDHYKTKLINKIKSLPELDVIMLGLKL